MKAQSITKRGHAEINLHQILALPHEEFLPQAFYALMGREPDAVGIAHYALRLKHGANRILVLAEMRNSLEGQAHAYMAPSPELDILTDRYRRVRGLPLGRWRWALLPRLGPSVPSEGFDWEHWASHYAGQQQAASNRILQATALGSSDIDQKFTAFEQRVDSLAGALQQAVSVMQEQALPTQTIEPIRQAIERQQYPAAPVSEVSWEARSAYIQLLQYLKIAF